MSNDRASLDHSGTHLTSLGKFGSSSFQDGGNEVLFTQTQHFFLDKLN